MIYNFLLKYHDKGNVLTCVKCLNSYMPFHMQFVYELPNQHRFENLIQDLCGYSIFGPLLLNFTFEWEIFFLVKYPLQVFFFGLKSITH